MLGGTAEHLNDNAAELRLQCENNEVHSLQQQSNQLQVEAAASSPIGMIYYEYLTKSFVKKVYRISEQKLDFSTSVLKEMNQRRRANAKPELSF